MRHIAPLRTLCVNRRGWLTEQQLERAIAATNLLPGPASAGVVSTLLAAGTIGVFAVLLGAPLPR